MAGTNNTARVVGIDNGGVRGRQQGEFDGDDCRGAAAATAAASTSAASTAPATTATSGGPTTTEAEGPIIPAAGTGKYGQDPNNKNLYVGPSGFNIDVSKCPSDWNINQGITSSEIDVFASYPKSGPLAGFSLLYDGMQAYYDYVAQNGGIDGRKIVMTVRTTSTRRRHEDELRRGAGGRTSTPLFDAVLGTPNNLGIWDDTNKECMPQLLNATGARRSGATSRTTRGRQAPPERTTSPRPDCGSSG